MAVVFLRFIDPDTNTALFDLPVESFKLNVGLNQSTEWSASISIQTPSITTIFRGMVIEFYVDGALYFEGVLQRFDPELTEKTTLSISGRSFLDNDLYSVKSYPLSYYDQAPILGVGTELLLQAGWALGDIGTLEETDLTTTIDLRGERNLLTQFNKFLQGLPRTYWREGVQRLDTHTVDLGIFNQGSGIAAIAPDSLAQFEEDSPYVHTIESFKYTVDFIEAAYAIRLQGGNINDAGTERVVNLGDALAVDLNLRLDTQYPIIEEVNERVWSVVNLTDYPYPGGRIFSSEDTLSNVITVAAIGDTVGGAVEANVHMLISFIPYPGLLNHITIRLGTRDVNFTSELGSVFDIYWRIYEIDPSDNRTVTAIIHHQVIPGAQFPAADMALILIPDTEIILEAGKLYGLGIGTTVGPVLDVARQVIIGANRTSVSNTFFMRQLNIPGGTLPVVGSSFNIANFVPVIEVVTDRIGTIFASAVTEKQEKFAPPKTGAASPSAEIQRAGYALYQYGKNYLFEHPPIKKEYSMSVVGTKHVPKPGDTLYVKGRATIEFFDEISNTVFVEIMEDIDGDLRVISYDMDFAKDGSIQINYKLQEGDGIPVTERLLALYDETKDQKPPEGDIWASPWGLLLDTISVNISNVSPNATFSDGTFAYGVTVSIFDGSVASLPTNTEWVYLAGNPYGTGSGGDLRIEVTEEPTFSSSGQITFLVAFANRGWEYGDSASLTIKLIWR